ncbi:hypothetical protein BC939DRAFT_496908 [Gamsiella multidivaricata]|uniref:uncharacterized protein n=1 Tax=Gamsiella multidivaricata TaxID=101098 RepID=UPI00221FB245|nr:uncharacterized protein BC939DRAFT_496908 [Gamsiella multidivaricata]KAI7817084.1 hypothetical protein BC939DRAFT_496908 [Gamsiella multidivaricata]
MCTDHHRASDIHNENKKRQRDDEPYNSAPLAYSPSGLMTSSPTSARRRPRIEYTLASAPSPLPFALDDLLPSDPADISYEDEGETYYDLGKVYANDFLVGEGRKDSRVNQQWVYDNIQIGQALLDFRDRAVENNFGISQPHEILTTSLEETKDPAARLLVPDYSVTTTIGLQTCTVISLEGKTAYNNGYGQIWDDLTKLGQELKYALDAIIKLQPLQPVCVQGILVKGSELDFYHMEIVSEGIYVLRRYARCCLCTDANNLYPLVRILEIMQGVKEMTSSTVTSVRQMKLRPSKTPLVPLSWLRTSFHKPRRIEIH